MLLVAAVFLGLGGCASAPEKPKSETYASEVEGFSIAFPSDWRKTVGAPGMNLEIMPPDQTDPNVFRDDLLVRVEPLADPLALDDYFAIKVALGAKLIQDYKEIEKGPAVLGGRPAMRLVYSYVNGDTPVTSMAYFLASGRRGYMVAASAVSNRFAERKPAFEAIVNTFQLLNQAGATETKPAAAQSPQ
jgi:hypothetical protein